VTSSESGVAPQVLYGTELLTDPVVQVSEPCATKLEHPCCLNKSVMLDLFTYTTYSMLMARNLAILYA
jgi:hypothetical protein